MMKKMSLDLLLKDKLDSEDLPEKRYIARYNGKHGVFIMSKKKLLFVEEKGFMHKNYNFILEIPYKQIHKNYIENKKKLVLIEGEGKEHNFTFKDPSACAYRISNILSAYLAFA
jgi:hypothetical protein